MEYDIGGGEVYPRQREFYDSRQVIIWYHDESIFYAHDRRRKFVCVFVHQHSTNDMQVLVPQGCQPKALQKRRGRIAHDRRLCLC